jgi:hypothetical protein
MNKNILIKEISQFVISEGFKFRKNKLHGKHFYREEQYGYLCIGVSDWNFNNLWSFSIFFLIRIEKVENLISPIIGILPEYTADSASIITYANYFNSKPPFHRYEIKSENDFKNALSEIKYLLLNQAIPLFNLVNSISDLDILVNNKERSLNGLGFPGGFFANVALAYLNRNENFAQICQKYRENINKDHYKYQDFAEFIKNLQSNILSTN